MAWVYSLQKAPLVAYLAEARELMPELKRADGGEPNPLAVDMVWDTAAPYGLGWVAREHPALPHGFITVQPAFNEAGEPLPPT